jgi:hypothetical protein
LAGLVAVLLAVAWRAESMRRVLIDAGGHLPATRGVTAEGTGTLATQMLPIGKPVAAIVLRDRVCVSRFLLLLGEASLAVRATEHPHGGGGRRRGTDASRAGALRRPRRRRRPRRSR